MDCTCKNPCDLHPHSSGTVAESSLDLIAIILHEALAGCQIRWGGPQIEAVEHGLSSAHKVAVVAQEECRHSDSPPLPGVRVVRTYRSC